MNIRLFLLTRSWYRRWGAVCVNGARENLALVSFQFRETFDETGHVSDEFIEYILLSHQVVSVCACVRVVGILSIVYVLIYVDIAV
jgi:hypothetical protein